MRVYQDSERARRFAEPLLKCSFADPMIGLVVERDARVVGAVILNNYTPGCNIDLSAVGKGVWTPTVVRDVFRYCFLRVKRVTALTRVDNFVAIKSLTKIGFKQEGILRDWFPDGDAVCLALLKREQKVVRI